MPPRAKKSVKSVVMPDETPAGFATVTPTVASTATEVKTKVVSKTALAIATAFLGFAAIAAGLVALPQSDPMYGYNNSNCWDSDYTVKNDAGMPLFRYSFVNQATKGTSYGIKTGTSEYVAGTDQCWNDKRLLEFFCDVKNNKVTWNSYNCAAGTSCVDGACVKPFDKGKLSFSIVQPPNSLTNGNNDFGHIKLSALDEDITMNSIKFTVFFTPGSYKDMTLSGLSLLDEKTGFPGTEDLVAGPVVLVPDQTASGTYYALFDNLNSLLPMWDPKYVEAEKEWTLRGDVTGVSTGAYISVRINPAKDVVGTGMKSGKTITPLQDKQLVVSDKIY